MLSVKFLAILLRQVNLSLVQFSMRGLIGSRSENASYAIISRTPIGFAENSYHPGVEQQPNQ